MIVLWAEAQYQSNLYCLGPPDAIKVFATDGPDDYTHLGNPLNETWPEIYSMVLNDQGSLQHPYVFCGNLLINLQETELCCTQSVHLTPEGSAGIPSGTDIIMIPELLDLGQQFLSDPRKLLNQFTPQDANSQTYCSLWTSNSSSLFGYVALEYLADGNCKSPMTHPSICFPNGTVAFYPEPDCQGAPEIIGLSKDVQVYSNSLVGNFNGTLNTVGGAIQKVVFTQVYPNYMFIPNYSTPADYLLVTFFVLSIVSHFAFTFMKALGFKKKLSGIRFWNLVILTTSQAIWSINSLFVTIYNMIIISGDAANGMLLICMYSQAIASYLTPVYSIECIFSFVDIKPTYRWAIRIVNFLVFLGLAGDYFVAPIYILADLNAFLENMNFFFQWQNFFSYWVVIMFIIDIIPVLVIGIRLGHNGTHEGGIGEIFRFIYVQNIYFFVYLVIQIIIITVYFSVTYTLNYTYAYYSDRTVLMMESFKIFLVAVHTIVSYFHAQTLQKLFMKESKATASVTGNDTKASSRSKTGATSNAKSTQSSSTATKSAI